MTRFLRILTSLALLLPILSEPASAQAPKPGKTWYEDAVDLGFKFKAPNGWTFTPAQSHERTLVGKYVAPGSQFLMNPKTMRPWDYALYILKFDRREVEGEKKRKVVPLEDWIDDNLSQYSLRKVEEKKSKVGKLPAVEYRFEGSIDGDYEVAFFATMIDLRPDVQVALGFNGPVKNWSKFERAFKSLTKSLKPLEIAEPAAGSGAGSSLRDQKRAELEAEVARSPGWELYETPNFFVISSDNDRNFMKQLLERLEAIRVVYEQTYPPALAQELRVLAAQRRHEEGGDEDEDEEEPEPEAAAEGEEGQEEGPGLTKAESADPLAASRTCVVRVCKNKQDYVNYGGSWGTAGYWSPFHKELVVFNDKESGGTDDTWATLNHEAFHQYIFYFFGKLAPHYWYNEGTGDFYSGFKYKNKRFTLKPFDWRERLIQQTIRDDAHVPLKEFVRYDRAKYYDPTTVGTNYAQGWALMWFLRTGAKNAPGWNDEWNTILDKYLRVLVETDELDEAVDAAFRGVDWDEFESCWKNYILKG